MAAANSVVGNLERLQLLVSGMPGQSADRMVGIAVVRVTSVLLLP